MGMKEEDMRKGEVKGGYNGEMRRKKELILKYRMDECGGDRWRYGVDMDDLDWV